MELTKRKRKDLYRKLLPVVRDRLLYLREHEYDYQEMRERTGIKNNRISEIVHFEKYAQEKDVLNERTLIQLLGGGLMKINELIKKQDLSKDEKSYLETLIIYESKIPAEDIKKLTDSGFTVGDAVKAFISSKGL